jgi:hypothetical protein
VAQYKTVLVGNVSDRWTKKGKEREMDALSAAINSHAQEGWTLHSIEPTPVFGGLTQKQTGVVLLGVFSRD